MVIHLVSEDIDPYMLNVVRFLLAGLVFLPFLLKDLRAILRRGKKGLKWLLIATASLVVAGTTYTMALAQAPASYIALFGLVSPVMIVAFASLIMRERISKRAFSGVVIAGMGAFILAAVPLLATNKVELQIYPLATFLAVVSAIGYPFYVVAAKEVTRFRIHVFSVISFSSLATSLASLGIWFVATDRSLPEPTPVMLLALLFMGVVVLGISRSLSFFSYKHLTSPVLSTMFYLESLLAVMLPVVLIGEKVSFEMLIGGLLIMLGVYVSGHHIRIHPHHHVMKP